MEKIYRREFLKKGALATVVGSTAVLGCRPEKESRPADASPDYNKKYVWKITTTWPPHFPILGEGVDLFAKWVEQLSSGRLTIKVYGAGELVQGPEAFDAVSEGAVEMAHSAPYYWAGKAPSSQFFASVPFGMNAQQMNAWIRFGGGQELWEELYAGFGVLPMLAGNTGVQMGGWFNKEINSMADIKGLKMRIPGLGGKVIAKAGGSAVSVSGGEIYTNLERGVIDATEWIGPFHDYMMGFYKVAKYYYYPGWHEPGTPLEILINKDKFETLPLDLQMIIRFAADKLNNWIFYQSEVKNNEYLNKLVKEENVQLREFPKEVMAQFRILSKEVCQELAAGDAMSKRVFESYEKFRIQAGKWSEVTEKNFYMNIQE